MISVVSVAMGRSAATLAVAVLPWSARALQASRRSRALPWLERPPGLDELKGAGKYAFSLTAGDFGFDPLGWAEVGWGLNAGESREDRDDRLYAYREAELKHGRLAMLAAVGWPVSELYDGRLSERFGLANDLVAPDDAGIGLAPSLLNGGLGQVTASYWAAVVTVAALAEYRGTTRLRESTRVGSIRAPGDLGFDPLGLYPSDAEDAVDFGEASKVFDMVGGLQSRDADDAPDDAAAASDDAGVLEPRLAPLERARRDIIEQELTHGRTAMLAIVGFVVQEFYTKVPVVEETPQFFIPDAGEVEAEREFAEVGRASVEILGDAVRSLLDALPHGSG